MFKILSLDENSFSLELSLLTLNKSKKIFRAYPVKNETIPYLRGEFLHYLSDQTLGFALRCFEINQAQKGIHTGLESALSFYKWSVIKKETEVYIWQHMESIMTEWIKVRAWLKIMLPSSTHPEYKTLKSELANMNEMNEMFLAEFKGKGLITIPQFQTV